MGQLVAGAMDTVVPAALLFDQGPKVNILLIGEDVPINNHRVVLKEDARSDTNMIISLDQATHSVFVLSLPRDLRVVIPGDPDDGHKLNAAHRNGGAEKLVATIDSNLGIRIHHYVKTNAKGFIALIDQVGGVDVDVERDMDYDDNWQDFHVHLKKGPQHLNGEQTQGYVRWRKNNNGTFDPEGDLGRVKRQQQVMRIVARKVLQPGQLIHLRSTIAALRGYVTTTLSDRQMGALMTYMQSVNAEAIGSETLPCDYVKPFMYLRTEEAVELLSAHLGDTFSPEVLRNSRAAQGPSRRSRSSRSTETERIGSQAGATSYQAPPSEPTLHYEEEDTVQPPPATHGDQQTGRAASAADDSATEPEHSGSTEPDISSREPEVAPHGNEPSHSEAPVPDGPR